MTPEQLSAICASFDKVRTQTPDIGARFYRRLSSDYPEITRVFNSVNMDAQHSRFVSMLHIILLRMNEGRPTGDLLKDLGMRHQRFGVSEDDYRKFGATLMAVLGESLGSEFDAGLRTAWLEAYQQIAESMRPAAEQSSKEEYYVI